MSLLIVSQDIAKYTIVFLCYSKPVKFCILTSTYKQNLVLKPNTMCPPLCSTHTALQIHQNQSILQIVQLIVHYIKITLHTIDKHKINRHKIQEKNKNYFIFYIQIYSKSRRERNINIH